MLKLMDIEDLKQVIISYKPLASLIHLMKMIMSVRFCLSYDLLNVILSPPKFVNYNRILYCCNGRCHDVTCSC